MSAARCGSRKVSGENDVVISLTPDWRGGETSLRDVTFGLDSVVTDDRREVTVSVVNGLTKGLAMFWVLD
jgi:hypothetical protein